MKLIDAFWTWPGEARYLERSLRPLNLKERALYERGRIFYTMTCSGCHQANGMGMPGLAPRLAGSEWVIGPPSVPIRIVQHGLQGPIKIGDETWDQEMPAVSGLTDEELAAIITYVRRSFGNEGDPVPTEVVTSERQNIKDRMVPWSADELRK
jgi:mono/diheme cytochrome c family protein